MTVIRPRLLLRLALATALWVLSFTTWADIGIAVVVGHNAPPMHINRATLRDIFLKKIFVTEQGDPYIPVNLPPGQPLRRAFALMLFRETGDELQSYWNERYFHGVRPPYVLGSQNAVLKFVARTPGAIGYVATCRVDKNVRTLLVLPVPPPERHAVDRLCNAPRNNLNS